MKRPSNEEGRNNKSTTHVVLLLFLPSMWNLALKILFHTFIDKGLAS